MKHTRRRKLPGWCKRKLFLMSNPSADSWLRKWFVVDYKELVKDPIQPSLWFGVDWARPDSYQMFERARCGQALELDGKYVRLQRFRYSKAFGFAGVDIEAGSLVYRDEKRGGVYPWSEKLTSKD